MEHRDAFRSGGPVGVRVVTKIARVFQTLFLVWSAFIGKSLEF